MRSLSAFFVSMLASSVFSVSMAATLSIHPQEPGHVPAKSFICLQWQQAAQFDAQLLDHPKAAQAHLKKEKSSCFFVSQKDALSLQNCKYESSKELWHRVSCTMPPNGNVTLWVTDFVTTASELQ